MEGVHDRLRFMSDPQTEVKGSVEKKEHLQGFRFPLLGLQGERENRSKSEQREKKGKKDNQERVRC